MQNRMKINGLLVTICMMLGGVVALKGSLSGDGTWSGKDEEVTISYNGSMPSSPEGDCCNGQGSWTQSGSATYEWSGDVTGSKSGTTATLATGSSGEKSVSLTIKQNWECTRGADTAGPTQVTASGDYVVVEVKLVKSENNNYPATDIFPHIAINAQEEYETAKYEVQITPSEHPDGGDTPSVLAFIESGPAYLVEPSGDDGNYENGDEVIVKPLSSESTGEYTVKIQSNEAPHAEDENDGEIFELKFKLQKKLQDYAPADDAGGKFEYIGSAFKVNSKSSIWQHYSGGWNAYVTNKHTIHVVASPSLPDEFEGLKVDANARIGPFKNEGGFILRKSKYDHFVQGGSHSVSGSVNLIIGSVGYSYGFPQGEDDGGIAFAGFGGEYVIDAAGTPTINNTYLTNAGYSTDSIDVPSGVNFLDGDFTLGMINQHPLIPMVEYEVGNLEQSEGVLFQNTIAMVGNNSQGSNLDTRFVEGSHNGGGLGSEDIVIETIDIK